MTSTPDGTPDARGSRRFVWSLTAGLLAALAACQQGASDDAAANMRATDPPASEALPFVEPESIPQSDRTDSKDADPTDYMGREIAALMRPRMGSWLLREDRAQEEGFELLFAWLNLQPGQTVADVGAGNGYLTLRAAEAVGPDGQVNAVDIQEELLATLRQRAGDAGLENVEVILGALDDPHLPPGVHDLVVVLDAYHEFSQPESMLRALGLALAPEGRLVIVEFRHEDPEVHPNAPRHKMTREQLRLEIEANGFRQVETFDDLPQQHALAFQRLGSKSR